MGAAAPNPSDWTERARVTAPLDDKLMEEKKKKNDGKNAKSLV